MAEKERTRPAPVGLGLRLLGQAVTGRLCREYIGARRIPLQPHTLESGAECLIAPDLVAQCAGPDGGLLATRGYHLYELDPDGAALRRRARSADARKIIPERFCADNTSVPAPRARRRDHRAKAERDGRRP